MDKDLLPSRNKSLGGNALIALAILSLVSLSFAGCKHTAAGLMLRTGKSFGMCAGYCFEEWMFTKETTSVTLKSFKDTNRNPQRTVSLSTPPDIWNQIASAAHMNAMQNLPGRIGCPDCADGGSEWVELSDGKTSKKVTFEYGKDVPQIHDLIVAARAATAALEKSAFPK